MMRSLWAKAISAVAALAAVVGGFAAFDHLTDPPHLAYEEAFGDAVRDVIDADNRLLRQAIEARQGSTLDYDTSAAAQRQLTVAVERLRRLEEGLWPGNADTQAAYDALAAATGEANLALRDFETQNSVFRVSLRYVPTAVEEFRAQWAWSPDAHELCDALDHASAALHEAVVEYSADRRAGLEAALAAAQEARDHAPAGAHRDADRILAHLRRAEERLVSSEAAIASLRAAQLAEHAGAMQHAGHAAFGEIYARIENAKRAQNVFSLIVLLLAVGFAAQLRGIYRTLEQRVAARTAELSAARADLQQLYDLNKLVLENVDRGLVAVDLQGHVVGDTSATANEWFGALDVGTSFVDALSALDPDTAVWLDIGLESVRDDILPIELALDQLPKRLHDGQRTWSIRWIPLERESGLHGLLAYVSDETARLRQVRQEQEQRDVLSLAQRLASDRRGTLAFIDEVDELFEKLTAQCQAAAVSFDSGLAFRRMHTIKGGVSLFGLHALAEDAHALESRLADEGSLDPGALESLERTWRGILGPLHALIGDRAAPSVDVPVSTLIRVAESLRGEASPHDVADELQALAYECGDTVLERLASQGAALAERLGKAHLDVRSDASGLRFDPQVWGTFWGAAVHLVRNAVDHGVDEAEERAARGKAPRATLSLSASLRGADVEVVVEDDGRGIDWDLIATKAAERGLPFARPEDVRNALFADGFTTCDDVSDTSGRGVGLAALRQAVEELGGGVRVESRRSDGTRFLITAPMTGVFAGRPAAARDVA